MDTVFAYLTLLAFLVDQVQKLGCRLFQTARQRFHSRTAWWQRLRNLVTSSYIADRATLWEALRWGHQRAGAYPGYLVATEIGVPEVPLVRVGERKAEI